MSEPHKPYIPASTVLPETTVKAFVLGALLSVILAAANAYLGSILLAVPIVIWEPNIFDLHLILPGFIGLACLLGVCFWLYKTTVGSFMKK